MAAAGFNLLSVMGPIPRQSKYLLQWSFALLLQYDAYNSDPDWPPENITIGYMIARPKEVDQRKFPNNPLRVRTTIKSE